MITKALPLNIFDYIFHRPYRKNHYFVTEILTFFDKLSPQPPKLSFSLLTKYVGLIVAVALSVLLVVQSVSRHVADSGLPLLLPLAAQPSVINSGDTIRKELNDSGSLFDGVDDRNSIFVQVGSNAPADAALEKLAQGHGLPARIRGIGNASPAHSTATSTYFFFRVANTGEDVVVKYAMPTPRRVAMWVWDGSRNAFALCAKAGTDIEFQSLCAKPQYAMPNSHLTLMPLPRRVGLEYVLVRVDDDFSVYNALQVLTPNEVNQKQLDTAFENGINVSSVVIALSFAAYYWLIYRKHSFAFLILSAIAYASRYVYFYNGALNFVDHSIALSRLMATGTYAIYFALHAIGIVCLVVEIRKAGDKWTPSWLVLGIFGLAIGVSVVTAVSAVSYAVFDLRGLAPQVTSWGTTYCQLICAVCTFFGLVFDGRSNGYTLTRLLIFSEAMLVASGLIFVLPIFASFTNVFVRMVFANAIYVDIFLWSIAINNFHLHLEQMARNTFEDHVRQKAQALFESRQALDRVNRQVVESTGTQHRAYATLLRIMRTYTHAALGAINALSIRNAKIAEHLPSQAETQQIDWLLNDLSEQVGNVRKATTRSLTEDFDVALVRDVLDRVLDVYGSRLASRGLVALVHVDDAVDQCSTYHFHLNEALREAISNVLKHASTTAPVYIEVTYRRGFIHLSISNSLEDTAILDIACLNAGERVDPARCTYNGEESHGYGLSDMHALLQLVGGRMQFSLPESGLFQVELTLPTLARRMPARNQDSAADRQDALVSPWDRGLP